MKLSRQFDSPWPVVLVEMKDFVELTRLTLGGGYQSMQVRVWISRAVPIEALQIDAIRQFRDWLEKIPRCPRPDKGFFIAHESPFHRIDIEVKT